jgi:hypothetical protein
VIVIGGQVLNAGCAGVDSAVSLQLANQLNGKICAQAVIADWADRLGHGHNTRDLQPAQTPILLRGVDDDTQVSLVFYADQTLAVASGAGDKSGGGLTGPVAAGLFIALALIGLCVGCCCYRCCWRKRQGYAPPPMSQPPPRPISASPPPDMVVVRPQMLAPSAPMGTGTPIARPVVGGNYTYEQVMRTTPVPEDDGKGLKAVALEVQGPYAPYERPR